LEEVRRRAKAIGRCPVETSCLSCTGPPGTKADTRSKMSWVSRAPLASSVVYEQPRTDSGASTEKETYGDVAKWPQLLVPKPDTSVAPRSVNVGMPRSSSVYAVPSTPKRLSMTCSLPNGATTKFRTPRVS
jgi:hypothetical protein